MSATRSFSTAAAIAALGVPARDSAPEFVRRPVPVSEDSERLPRGIAYAIILLMSVACWGLVATVGLWLWQVLG